MSYCVVGSLYAVTTGAVRGRECECAWSDELRNGGRTTGGGKTSTVSRTTTTRFRVGCSGGGRSKYPSLCIGTPNRLSELFERERGESSGGIRSLPLWVCLAPSLAYPFASATFLSFFLPTRKNSLNALGDVAPFILAGAGKIGLSAGFMCAGGR